jgi:hypothetical protein
MLTITHCRAPVATRQRSADGWTDARIELLRDLWAAGHTATEIGEALDLSRNAVLGKARRLKLAVRKTGT